MVEVRINNNKFNIIMQIRNADDQSNLLFPVSKPFYYLYKLIGINFVHTLAITRDVDCLIRDGGVTECTEANMAGCSSCRY